MNIGMVSSHACIRMHKQGWTLVNQGYKVHLAAAMLSQCHSYSGYESVNVYFDSDADGNTNGDQLARWVQIANKYVDVYHVHNEPNWIFRVVRQNTNKPVIWDIHDWTSLRKVKPPYPDEVKEEEYALDAADGFVVCSRGYLNRVRSLTNKPSILIYSKVPSFLYPEPKKREWPGLTFEGGVKGKTDIRYNFQYRNWADVAIKVSERDDMWFYTANPGEDFGDYKSDRIHFTHPLPYNQLLDNLGRHTAGLVGSPFPVADFDDAMPNKLFEYVASGIPCIVMNSQEAQKYVESEGIGVGVRDASEIHDALKSLTDHRVLRDRWGFTLDGEIPKLIALYQEVMCIRSPRVIARMDNYDRATDADLITAAGSN